MKLTAIMMLAVLAVPTMMSAQSIEPNAVISDGGGFKEADLRKMSLFGNVYFLGVSN